MAHCGGGSGPSTFDTLGTLDRWRREGAAPAQMMVRNNQSGLARPLCPYPSTPPTMDRAIWPTRRTGRVRRHSLRQKSRATRAIA